MSLCFISLNFADRVKSEMIDFIFSRSEVGVVLIHGFFMSGSRLPGEMAGAMGWRCNVSTSALVLCVRKSLSLTHTHRVKEDQHLDAEGMGASLENAIESIHTGIRTVFLFGRIISPASSTLSPKRLHLRPSQKKKNKIGDQGRSPSVEVASLPEFLLRKEMESFWNKKRMPLDVSYTSSR